MKRHLLRGVFAVFVCACALALTLSRHSAYAPAIAATPTPVPSASAAPTPASTTAPGTQITNAASATYSDGTNTYSIQSNTVTVTVQNAPSLVVLTNNGTVTGAVTSNGLTPAASPVPGNTLSEVYTLVNTGNATGNFALATAAQSSPTPLPGTNNGTTISGPQTGVTYTVTCASLNDTVTTIAALNTDLASPNCNTAAGSVVNIAINYQANAPGTVTSQLEAQITYGGSGTGYNAASSVWTSNQYNDSIVADERVDVQKSPQPIASDGTVTYVVTVNNGGNSPANYVNDYGTTCGTNVLVCGPALGGPGILISDRIPVGASTPYPVVSMAPSPGPQALSAGETVKMVYTTDTSAKTGWTQYSGGGFPAGTAYVGLFLSGNANGIGLPADPTPAPTSGPGSVAAAASQIGWKMQMGPIVAGQSVNNIVVVPAGDNKGCIEGPGINTTATACGTGGSNPPAGTGTPGDPTAALTTPPPVPSSPGPGLSNTGQITTPSLFNGPLGQADAQGCFNNAQPAPFPTWSPMPNPWPTIAPATEPTCAATDNMNDYTEVAVTPSPAASPMTYGTQMPSGFTTVVTSAVKNPGTQSSAYQLTFPTLPASLTVTSVTYGSGACSTTSTPAAGVYPLGTINAGATIQYCVTYQTAGGSNAAYLFQPQFVQARVAATSAPTVYYNDTWHIVMPGGFMELVKTATIGTGGGCSGAITGGLPSLGVCPGGIIQYAVLYMNTLPSSVSGTPAEPASASLAVSGSFVITENGAATGSNWATYTGGLYDPANPASVLQSGLSLSAMAASCGVITQKCGDTSAAASFTNNTLTQTSFTDSIPSTDPNVAAQHYGVLMFATKVK